MNPFAGRMPVELAPGRSYNRLTNVERSYTYRLGDDRMPTLRGPGGVVADRTFTVPPLNPGRPQSRSLVPIHFQARLPRVEPKGPYFVVQVVDYDYWRFDSPRKLRPWQLPAGRYRVELWDAAPDEVTDSGDPERDLSWEPCNPAWSFDVSKAHGLIGARAAAEALALALVQGFNPYGTFRSQRTINAEVIRRRARGLRLLALVADPAEKMQLAQQHQAAFSDWLNRPDVQANQRVQRQMREAAARAEKAARPRPSHVRAALKRGQAHRHRDDLFTFFPRLRRLENPSIIETWQDAYAQPPVCEARR